jgi:hypothetical protein
MHLPRIALLLFLAPSAQVTAPAPSTPVPLHIEVTQSAYVGEPIWVTATSGPVQNVRYPFHAAMEDMGCNRIDLKHNGAPLPTLPLRGHADQSGILCGSAAPAGSPPHRLPLHALFDISTAGTYSVRWTELSFGAVSDWISFEVLQPTAEQHERWLSDLLAHPPENAGLLAGDFLPSLLAGVPDTRVLKVFVNYLHTEDAMVSGMAAAGLEHFPLSEVRPAVTESIEQSGPSEAIAYFATYHSGWTQSDENRIVHAASAYLQPSRMPSQSAAAYKLLGFIFNIPNHSWPADPKIKAYADEQVLGAAPSVIAGGDPDAVHELAVYLGSMSSPRAHELLQRIAERTDSPGEQARIALTWHPEPADLPRLAALLTTPGDPDPRGTDRSSLPYSLVRGYGDAALPYLEQAVSSSPYVWVRTQSAEQLALHNRPAGFQFLLNALESNQPYRTEMIQWVRSSFRQVLPPDANDQQVGEFLRSRIEMTR